MIETIISLLGGIKGTIAAVLGGIVALYVAWLRGKAKRQAETIEELEEDKGVADNTIEVNQKDKEDAQEIDNMGDDDLADYLRHGGRVQPKE